MQIPKPEPEVRSGAGAPKSASVTHHPLEVMQVALEPYKDPDPVGTQGVRQRQEEARL